MKLKRLLALIVGCICAGDLAQAGQTVSYTYNALGRLTKVQSQGGSGNSMEQTFSYDAAGNREEYQTLLEVTLSMGSTAALTSAGAKLTVLLSNPAAGGTVIFSENGTSLGSASVSGGQATATFSALPKGTYTITASYSGDGADAPETTTFTVKVQDLSWLPAVLQLLLR